MTRILSLCLSACLAAGPAFSDTLHCLGLSPGFMLVLEGDEARFDYLGDGVFAVSPPLTLPLDGFGRFDLQSYGGPVPLYVEAASCRMFGAELAFSIEIGVQTSQGMRPMYGCCREAD
jgi:hypothetical protein